MEKINCIVIDDEPLARKGLLEYINEVPFLHCSGEFDNPLKATGIIAKENVQLIFLDIQMPKLSGLDFYKTLQPSVPVIFITAFPEHAIEGFELNAIDYLVKPVSFDRFYKSVLRVKEYYEIREQNDGSPATSDDYFYIKSDNKLVRISFDEILFAEALQNYVCIHTVSKKYITYLTFKSIEEYLPSDRFIRTHKSYIVAAGRIDSIDGNEIRIGNHSIPISRNSREDVVNRLLKGKLLRR